MNKREVTLNKGLSENRMNKREGRMNKGRNKKKDG